MKKNDAFSERPVHSHWESFFQISDEENNKNLQKYEKCVFIPFLFPHSSLSTSGFQPGKQLC